MAHDPHPPEPASHATPPREVLRPATDAVAQPDAFSSFVEKRYVAEPEARLVAVMIGSSRTPQHLALASLDHEWMELAFGPSDGSIAAAKVAWWRDEVARYAAGRAQHPVTRVLAASTDPVSADDLQLAMDALVGLVQLESPGDVDELLAPFRRYAIAVLPWWGADDRDTGAVDAFAAALALQQLRQWPRFARPERALVPLSALAGAGLNRVELVGHGAHAVAARVVAQLARELGARVDASVSRRSGGAAGVDAGSTRLSGRIASARALAAAIQRRPERALTGEARAAGLPLLFRLWRIARRDR